MVPAIPFPRLFCRVDRLPVATRSIGQWGFPGGHLEQYEDFFTCVERETLEETGLKIRGIKMVGTTNDKFPKSNKHYVTIFTHCERKDPSQQPEVRVSG
jgi:8-oxo-dGTP diphosphatase